MVKVLQIGEGNFLRTFVDAYFDSLNNEKLGNYSVSIVKPIPFGNLNKFEQQNNKYSIVLRGVKQGQAVEDVYHIDCVDKVFSPFENEDLFYSFAKDSELKIIVSNTTEAGICFNANDKFSDQLADVTYPAKLTKFLFERFKSGLDGVYLLPVELIDNNADELYRCVNEYIKLWNLGEDFQKWNDSCNFYCNTLVDRIVSGYPKDENTKNHLIELLGYEDSLVSIGEPFGLWAVEDKGDISKYIFSGVHNIEVVLTKNIAYYKKRKVRVLNGSHTNFVPFALYKGHITVCDAMKDEKICKFIKDTLTYEIIPFVSDDIAATTSFADSVIERFFNPFLNHQLSSITLNSVSKWKARDLPSFKDYYQKYGKIPTNMTIGFAYLTYMYLNIQKLEDKFQVVLRKNTFDFRDDEYCMTYFLKGKTVLDFMKDENLWGMDLTTFESFFDTVNLLLVKIDNDEDLL